MKTKKQASAALKPTKQPAKRAARKRAPDPTQPDTKRARTRGASGSLPWQRAFLVELDRSGNVQASCEAVEINRATAYEARDRDPAFAAKWKEALEIAMDRLEGEAWRRAVDGTRRLKFGKDGEALIDPETGKTYIEREFSDTLMVTLLKAHRPEKYRDNFKVEGEIGATDELSEFLSLLRAGK